MNETQENPFASPAVVVEASGRSDRLSNSQTIDCLAPLWLWTVISLAAAYLGTPADPIATLLAMGINLLALWLGMAIGGTGHWIVRFLLVAIFGAPLAVLTYGLGAYYFPAIPVLLGVAFGAWSGRVIHHAVGQSSAA